MTTAGSDSSTLKELWRTSVLGGADPATARVDVSYRPGAGQSPTVSDATLPMSATPPPPPPGGPRPDAPTGYELITEIGRGGMGVVFRAHQRSLDRDVAIKTLNQRAGVDLVDQFLAEARTTGALSHPNIVPVYDLGTGERGEPFLAMKLVGGRPWGAILHPQNEADDDLSMEYDLARNIGVLITVCNAVAYAHSRGVIHRDLKPSNVMVGEFGEVLLMDWGLAERCDDDPVLRRDTPPCGTPVYMSPELARGRRRDQGPWTDVYLLGAILHEIVCGAPPHRQDTLPEVLDSALRSDPPRFPPHIPEELERICRKAMARDPADRHPTALDLRRELEAFLRHRESIALARDTRDRLRAPLAADARPAERHQRFSRGVAGFEQALVLWAQNREAADGLRAVRLEWARSALDDGDFALAEAQVAALDAEAADVAPLRRDLAAARAARARVLTHQRRLKVALAAAAVLIVLTIGTGLIFVSIEQRKTQDALDRERIAHGEADRRAADLRGLANSLVYELHDAIEHLPGATPARAVLMKRAVESLDRLASGASDDPAVLVQLADAYERTAFVESLGLSGNLGNATGALDHFRRSVDLRRRALALRPDVVDYQRGVSTATRQIAEAHVRLGQLPEARRAYDEAQRLLAPVLAAHGDHPLVLRDQGGLFQRIAQLDRLEGRTGESLAGHQRCVELAERLMTLRNGDAEASSDLAGALQQHAYLLSVTGDTAGARREYDRALTLERKLAASMPQDVPRQRNLSVVLEEAGQVAQDTGDHPGAERMFRESLALREKIAHADPLNAQAKADLGGVWFHLGALAAVRADPAGALQCFHEWQRLAKECAIIDPHDANARRDLVISAIRVAEAQLDSGDPASAEATLAEARPIAEERRHTMDRDADATIDLMQLLMRLGDCAVAQGHTADGTQLFLQARETGRAFGPAALQNAVIRRTSCTLLERLGDSQRRDGDLGAARATFEEAVRDRTEESQRNPSNFEVQRDLAVFHVKLAEVLELQQELGPAEETYRAALRTMERAANGANNPAWFRDVGTIRHSIASVELARGDLPAARLSLNESIAALRKVPPDDILGLRELSTAFDKLADVEVAAKDPVAAAAAVTRAIEFAEAAATRAPTNVLVQSEWSRMLSRSADLALERHDEAAALPPRRRSIEILARLAAAADASAEVKNSYAWHLLTDLPESVRDLRTGLDQALLAVRASNARDPGILDTLAYAYWLNGQQKLAIETEEKALALVPAGPGSAALRTELEANLRKFRAGPAETRP